MFDRIFIIGCDVYLVDLKTLQTSVDKSNMIAKCPISLFSYLRLIEINKLGKQGGCFVMHLEWCCMFKAIKLGQDQN